MSFLNSPSLTGRPLRKRLITEYSAEENPRNPSHARAASHWIDRHANHANVPSIIFYPNGQERQTLTPTVPTVFIYDQDRCEVSTCSSMDDIPPIRADQRLWIDVTGVSPSPSLTFDSTYRYASLVTRQKPAVEHQQTIPDPLSRHP